VISWDVFNANEQRGPTAAGRDRLPALAEGAEGQSEGCAGWGNSAAASGTPARRDWNVRGWVVQRMKLLMYVCEPRNRKRTGRTGGIQGISGACPGMRIQPRKESDRAGKIMESSWDSF